MAFEEALAEIARKVERYGHALLTEEATKAAVVMPFIKSVLGYDVFDPTEVVPDFVADAHVTEDERVDFAILRGGEVQMLVEAKHIATPLAPENVGQLERCFHASCARVAILTNGRHWYFYTDLDAANRMDEKPFLRLDLGNIDAYVLPELRKLRKDAFDPDGVLFAADRVGQVSDLKRAIAEQFEAFVTDQVDQRVASVLGAPGTTRAPGAPAGNAVPDASPGDSAPAPGVDVASHELGFHIVRAILASDVPFDRVAATNDASTYRLLLDGDSRNPICTLHINRTRKYVGLFDQDMTERREPLERVEELYHHADALRETVRRYL